MKITIVAEKPKFEPIDIQITIQSVKELDSLIARLAVHTEAVNHELDSNSYTVNISERASLDATKELFNILYELKRKLY